jgi:hypothetical protein
LKEFVKVPGPGTYNPDDKIKSTSRDAPHWRMGTHAKLHGYVRCRKGAGSVTERMPGSGSYEVKDQVILYVLKQQVQALLKDHQDQDNTIQE